MKVAVRSSQHSPMFGAAGLLADGVEVPLAHEGLEADVVRAAGRTDLEPGRLARLGFPQSVGLDDGEASASCVARACVAGHYATRPRAWPLPLKSQRGSGPEPRHSRAQGKSGAEGGTRTPTGYPTRPSNVRVCQFRHFGAGRMMPPAVARCQGRGGQRGQRSRSRGYEGFAQPLAEEVEGQHDDQDRRPGDQREPGRVEDVALAVGRGCSPRSRRAAAPRTRGRTGSTPSGSRRRRRAWPRRGRARCAFGTRWRAMIRRPRAPDAWAACTNSLLPQGQDLRPHEPGRALPARQADHDHDVPDRRPQDGDDRQDQEESRERQHDVDEPGDERVDGQEPERPHARRIGP